MKEELLVNHHVDVSSALELWGDIDSYNENLKEFYHSLMQKYNELEGYKTNHDYNNYAILAHSMKSEAKYFGFMNEANVFLEHELKGKENDAQYIEQHFADLKKVVLQTYDLLSEYFNEGNFAKKNILVVDDSDIVLNFITKLIENQYNVIKAMNGQEALEKLKMYDIYAILLDLNMPYSNGFEVLNYLKEHQLMAKIPVVVVTGDDTVQTIEKAFSFPILDVLNKPFTSENMQSVLDSIVDFHSKNN